MYDGIASSFVSGERKILEYGAHGPARVEFHGTDKLGRSIEATGTIEPGLVFTGYTDHTVIWSLAEWQVSGMPFLGDNQEFYPAGKFRSIARGELRLGEFKA